MALYKKGDYRAALAEFQDLVIERGNLAGAWYYIGLCEFNLKHYDRVELPLGRAIALLEVQSPASADLAGAWYTLGLSHYLAQRYEKALQPLARYVELNRQAGRPVDASARAALGRSYYHLERYDEALPLLAAAEKGEAKERTANAYYAGVIYYKRGDVDQAIAAFREAVAGDPEDAAALELLAESLMRKAGAADAPALWEEAAEAGEKLRAVRDDLKTAGLLGRAWFGARKFDRAGPPLEKVARAEPENGQAWLYYGIALSRGGQSRKAMEALEITIQLLPDSAPALAELAYVYETDKQYPQALRVYEKAYALTHDAAVKQSIERVRALIAQQP